MFTRRKFLSHTTKGIALASLTSKLSPLFAEEASQQETPKEPHIVKYNRFGRTEMMVSDLSFGGGLFKVPSLASLALQMGVNYFDTAPDYEGGMSEVWIGDAIKKAGMRDKVYIATKFCNKNGHLLYGAKSTDMILAVENSLKQLQTDYIDVMLLHSVGDFANDDKRILDPELFTAVEKLRQDGKIKFLGVACHTAKNMIQLLDTCIESGKYDMIMLIYNWADPKATENLLIKAKNKDIGVVAMKVTFGAKRYGIDPKFTKDSTFDQACIKWTLSNENIDTAVISYKNVNLLKECISMSGVKVSKADIDFLNEYRLAVNNKYCRVTCGVCNNYCTQGVAISSIMRYLNYYFNYDAKNEARRLYSLLKDNQKSHSCNNCSAPCESHCPYNIKIKDELCEAHKLLVC